VGVWSAPPRADKPFIILQITRRANIKEGNESQGNTATRHRTENCTNIFHMKMENGNGKKFAPFLGFGNATTICPKLFYKIL